MLAHIASIAVSVVDQPNDYRVITLRGTVTQMTHEGAYEHIDFLARKYLGTDYANRRAGEQRVNVRIRPERIAMQPQ